MAGKYGSKAKGENVDDASTTPETPEVQGEIVPNKDMTAQKVGFYTNDKRTIKARKSHVEEGLATKEKEVIPAPLVMIQGAVSDVPAASLGSRAAALAVQLGNIAPASALAIHLAKLSEHVQSGINDEIAQAEEEDRDILTRFNSVKSNTKKVRRLAETKIHKLLTI